MWAQDRHRSWLPQAWRGRRLAILSCCAFAALLVSLAPRPKVHAANPPAERTRIPPPLEVAALKVSLGAAVPNHPQMARRLAHHFLSQTAEIKAGDVSVKASRARLGLKVDLAHLTRLLEDAEDERSLLRRYHERARPGQPLRLPMPIGIERHVALSWLKRLKDATDRAPREAQIDPRKQTVLAAVSGRSLDLFASLEALRTTTAAGGVAIEAVVHEQPAESTLGRLDDVKLDTVLASFETPYSLNDKARARTHNLRTAAAKLDGHVIPAGATFDFNQVVGNRTQTNGFKLAKVISSGRLVEGMGGGTCQVASTLHAAAFFAGLPILARHPHSRPSGYIKLGLDAAVAFGTLNLRFQNDHDFPIVLGVVVDGGTLRATLYGARGDRTVTFVRRIERALPFAEELVEDETLPRGLRVLTQRGVAGFEVTRFRTVETSGGSAVRQRSTDVYPPTPQIWRIGTGPEADDAYHPPENDPHPEYVADEYLRAVRTPGKTALRITRRPGRYGTYGWTEREGLRLQADGNTRSVTAP